MSKKIKFDITGAVTITVSDEDIPADKVVPLEDMVAGMNEGTITASITSGADVFDVRNGELTTIGKVELAEVDEWTLYDNFEAAGR